jgi:hypothetical protein
VKAARGSSGVALALGLGACGPVDDGPTSRAPINACVDESACARYDQKPQPVCQQAAGFCALPGGAIADLTFVVSVPDGEHKVSGNTFLVTYADLTFPTPRDPKCPRCLRLRLPPLGQAAGTYSVNQTAAQKVKFGVGSEENNHSLPVRATFRPAWFFGDGARIDAALLGMDLQPVFAVPLQPPELAAQFPGPGYADPDTGALPPSQAFEFTMPHGTYEETLEPLPPFDQAFPPHVAIIDFEAPEIRSQTDFTNILFGLPSSPPISTHDIAVSRAGGLSLEGWTLFLRDDLTRRPVSSTARLHEGGRVQINTTLQTLPAGPGKTDVSLVLSPPADSRLPELAHLLVDPVVPNASHYPLLPLTVTVQGFVAGADGTPVRADIVLESTALDVMDEDGTGRDLRFVDEFQTRGDATYERVLSPGKYKAIITPLPPGVPDDPAAGYAKTMVDFTISAPQSPSDRFQAGRKLEVVKSVNLSGLCMTTDGRIVPDAEVEAHAAAGLRYAASGADRDPLRWPESVRVRTNPFGRFSLPVSPGMTYDIVVRPAAGSHFPWVVVPQVVAPPSADLQIPIGAPIEISVILQDVDAHPLNRALVRAFKGQASTVPNAPKVVVEIGRARTDENGLVELYLDERP